MLNRRHLRIKVLQVLYAFFQSSDADRSKAEKELLLSIERMYDMYLFLMLALPEMKRAALNRQAELKKKCALHLKNSTRIPSGSITL